MAIDDDRVQAAGPSTLADSWAGGDHERVARDATDVIDEETGSQIEDDDDDDGDDDDSEFEPEDCAIVYYNNHDQKKNSNPFLCMLSLIKALIRQGSIRRCEGHLDLSCCTDLSAFALLRISISLLHLKTLAYFSSSSSSTTTTTTTCFACGSEAAAAAAAQQQQEEALKAVAFYESPLLSVAAAHGPSSATSSAGDGGGDDDDQIRSEAEMQRMAKLCVMASKLAYETEDVIRAVVTSTWKMKFIEFFDSWNEHVHAHSTEAFMLADAEDPNASVVAVAFRGTETWSWSDWATNLDFSYYKVRGVGRVHIGYLEALGLGTRDDKWTLRRAGANAARKARGRRSPTRPTSGLATETVGDGSERLAYDAISARLRSALDANPRAKLFLTGHSLGGALATVFAAFRLLEAAAGGDPRLGGVFTFGQPRVGDGEFARFVESRLSHSAAPRERKFFRVVFRSDVVPRVPGDDPVFRFKHIAPCVFYDGAGKSQVLREQPYKNLISDILQPMPRLSEIHAIFQTLFQRLHGRTATATSIVPLHTRLLAVFAPSTYSHFLAYYIDAINNAPSSFLGEAV